MRSQHLTINSKGTDYVVGDLHGCISALKQALTIIGFNPNRDRLISVGDLVDRGYENLKALEFLSMPWFYAVRGNHEQLHIDQDFDAATANGMEWALTYHQRRNLKMKLDEHDQQYFVLVGQMKQLPVLIDIATPHGLVGIVHAETPHFLHNWQDVIQHANALTEEQIRDSDLLWGRKRASQTEMSDKPVDHRIKGVKAILCGHTPVDQATWIGNHLDIDTGMVFGVMGRADLHEKPSLTLVNITDAEITRFNIRYGEVQAVTERLNLYPD